MKKLLILTLGFLISTNCFAVDLEVTTKLFLKRLVERSFLYYGESTTKLATDVPEEVFMFRDASFVDLINFASAYDLFDKGFRYEKNPDIYEVIGKDGEIKGYTYSITIFKDEEISSIGFFELQKRYDGVLYMAREPAYY